MESPPKMFDTVKFEKDEAIARFNRLRRVMRLWQILRFVIVSAAISWCAPPLARSTAACLADFSTCLFSHHVVFLIGNAIIVSLLLLRRQGDGGGGGDFYDDYVKFSDVARALPPTLHEDEEAAPVAEFGVGGDDCDKQIVVVSADEMSVSSQCDDVAAAIEKAARQIRRFQRNKSEILRREIAVQPELRRSETACRRKTTSPELADIENVSSEEFQRRVEAFIDKHWIKRAARLEGNESLQLKLREN